MNELDYLLLGGKKIVFIFIVINDIVYVWKSFYVGYVSGYLFFFNLMFILL